MPAQRMTMRKIREVLRLKFESGLSIRNINACTKSSVGAIQKVLAQARKLDLSWPLPDDLDPSLIGTAGKWLTLKSSSPYWGLPVIPMQRPR